jgi:hypothetical protein
MHRQADALRPVLQRASAIGRQFSLHLTSSNRARKCSASCSAER